MFCVWFCFNQLSLKIPWILCKMCLKLENLRRIVWNSYFWENWVQNKCFWKHLISYSCMWFINFNTLRSFCIILLCFSQKKKNCFFPEFQSIERVFQPIKIAIKILVWFCVFRSMLDWYWINRSIFDLSNFFFNWSKIV